MALEIAAVEMLAVTEAETDAAVSASFREVAACLNRPFRVVSACSS